MQKTTAATTDATTTETTIHSQEDSDKAPSILKRKLFFAKFRLYTCGVVLSLNAIQILDSTTEPLNRQRGLVPG